MLVLHMRKVKAGFNNSILTISTTPSRRKYVSNKNLVLGLQHIGIPTNSIKKTVDFFTSLDFNIMYEAYNNEEQVAFLELGDVVIETYKNHQATMMLGAIDHIVLNSKFVYR